MSANASDIFRGVPLEKILPDKRKAEAIAFLRPMEQRAEAKASAFRPITVEERLEAFKRMRYIPHGIFLPDSETLRKKLLNKIREIGNIENVDQRQQLYVRVQELTSEWDKQGNVPGHWTGQQGVARSTAKYRLVAWGRRGGKTTEAAREALAVALLRPRSTIWLAAPIMRLVGRAFDMILTLIADMGLVTLTKRDTAQEKLLVLENGSRIEGVSLEEYKNVAGTGVDFCVVDEAAQMSADAWTRAILPPLSDREGQALLISSWEGEEGFFYEKAQEAETDMLRGIEPEWAFFQAPSYDVNFWVFPQGRRSSSLRSFERQMSAVDFAEQFGAIPAGAKGKIYPEFRQTVHIGNYPYNSTMPVHLAVDPSGGASPYAVSVIQDYGDYLILIDEYYVSHVSAEEVMATLRQRVWRANVQEVVIDSAVPTEVERWSNAGWPAIAVYDKPKIDHRIPIQRNWIRDPHIFHDFYRVKVNQILADRELPADYDLDQDPEFQRSIAFQVEELLNDNYITAEDTQHLRQAAKLFVHNTCYRTIEEFKTYRYRAQRRDNNIKEIPEDRNNHLMDAIGYFLWQYKRFDGAELDYSSASYLRTASQRGTIVEQRPEQEVNPLTGTIVSPPINRNAEMLRQLRNHYKPQASNTYTTLRSA